MIIIKYDEFRWSEYIDRIVWENSKTQFSLIICFSLVYGNHIGIIFIMSLLYMRTIMKSWIERCMLTFLILFAAFYTSNHIYICYIMMYEILRLVIILLPELSRTLIRYIEIENYKLDPSLETLICRVYDSVKILKDNPINGALIMVDNIEKYCKNEVKECIPEYIKTDIYKLLKDVENIKIAYNEKGIVVNIIGKLILINQNGIKTYKNKLKLHNKQIICNICINKKNNMYITDCNHNLCEECIYNLIIVSNKCPYCRREIT